MSVTNNIDNLRSQRFAGVYPERSRGNALNRVVTAQTNATYSTSPTKCWGESYSYDHWANLLGTALPSSSYTNCSQESPGPGGAASANNQLSTRCYDAAGNLVLNAPCPQPPATPFTPTYSYDAENHLVYAGGVNYTYDGDGNRVMKSNGPIYWYGSGDDVLDETDLHGNLTNEYVFFNGARIARRDPSGNAFYYFDDHLGTARSIAEVPSGQTTATLCYDADFYPFGGERWYTDTCDSHYKFTGKERDSESGLDNFGARYNSSSIGRFMSPDAFTYALKTDPQTWNLYSYVANNPLNRTDLDGHDWFYVDKKAQNQNQAENQPNQPQQPEAPKPPPSWDPKQPLPGDPTKLGPDWKRDPGHKAPNDERWVNDKTGDKLDWHRGQPGEKGWKGKDHWHWNEHDWHFKPGDTVARVSTVIAVGTALYWVASEASRVLVPERNLVPVP